MSNMISQPKNRSRVSQWFRYGFGGLVVLLCAGLLAIGVRAQTPAKPVPPAPIDGPGSTYSQPPRAEVPHSPTLPYGLALMARFDLLPTLRDTKCVMDSSYEHSGGN